MDWKSMFASLSGAGGADGALSGSSKADASSGTAGWSRKLAAVIWSMARTSTANLRHLCASQVTSLAAARSRSASWSDSSKVRRLSPVLPSCVAALSKSTAAYSSRNASSCGCIAICAIEPLPAPFSTYGPAYALRCASHARGHTEHLARENMPIRRQRNGRSLTTGTYARIRFAIFSSPTSAEIRAARGHSWGMTPPQYPYFPPRSIRRSRARTRPPVPRGARRWTLSSRRSCPWSRRWRR